jgi:hypothetical protein
LVWTEKLGPDASDNERKVFTALDDPRWGWRTIAGIADDTGVDRAVVKDILLKHRDLLRISVSEKLGPIYQLIERTEPPEEKFIEKVLDYLSMGRRRIA